MGVVSQSIKDVNKELCDDGLVLTDKMGSGVFFWSFPSANLHQKKMEEQRLQSVLGKRKVEVAEIESKLQTAKETRHGSGREEKIRRLRELAQKKVQLMAVLEENKLNDPEQVENLQKQAKANLDHANRWVDNTYAIMAFLTKKKGLPSKEACRYLQINDDFDYFEDKSL